MVGFRVDVDRLVVRFSVGVVRPVSQVQRNVHIYIYIFVICFDPQTVLFRPLRSRQCSSEWFENWDMSTAQRAISTSHTDKQWHILFLNTRVINLGGFSKRYSLKWYKKTSFSHKEDNFKPP